MDLAHLIAELQGHGLRAEVPMERRQGGAGPADAGMLWIDGVAATVPTSSDYAHASPYVLRAEDDGWGIYGNGRRLASARPLQRPRYYDLETADGIPYWKIALLHLDSLASTVIQTCAYWGNSDQCTFCGIGVTLANGRTIAKKTPEMLAEVAGLPVEVQFEPPADLNVIDQVAGLGIDSVGVHVESFDPEVLARVAPAKARTGIDGYFRAWERAVAAFGAGQVSTYVILGM